MASTSDPLRYAAVLLAIGEPYDAEAEVVAHLESHPDDLDAVSLLAKIKHARGELSEAVALWTQIQAGGTGEAPAAARLASMLHLARDPERGSGEFLALGPFQLWRKPKAMLELERAFHVFVSRRPEEAGAICEQLAQRHRGTDPDVFKLAVLARAWIAELSGDYALARGILERLGNERGFEGDVDRALALARVCEAIGTKAELETAVHIYEFLSRGRTRVTIAGHLAALQGALGRPAEKALAERRFAEAFRRRMHLPSFGDAALAAAERYLPLEKLARLAAEPVEPERGWPPRAAAVAHALRGAPAETEALLAASAEPLDRAYLGDLALAAGDRARAAALYGEALGEGWAEPRLLGWLLEEHAFAPTPETARLLAREAPRAREALGEALRESPLRASLWRQLATLAAFAGDTAEERRLTERALALTLAAERWKGAVGRVYAAAVYHLVGGARGLVHEVWADRRPVAPGRGGYLEEVLGNATPELTQAVKNTFVSVREYALAKLPHLAVGLLDHDYSFKITKEDEPSGGLSGGLPAALAFLSVFMQRPVPRDLAATGVLVADAHDVLVVRPVGEVELKLRGAWNRGLRLLLVPQGNRGELERSRRVPRPYVDRMAGYVADLDEAVSLVFGRDVWLR